MKSIKTALVLSASLAAATAVTALPAQAQTNSYADTTVVLVHGAFADTSSWDKVIPLLQAKGLKVIAVNNPLTSLADDAAATKQVIDAQTGRVILVGHSWGGAVITQAGADDKVKALVYVAAFAPSDGEAVGQLGKEFPVPPGVASLKPTAAGFLYVPEDSMIHNFAPDLPAATAKIMAVTQGPIQGKAFGEVLTVAAWKTRPSYYIVSANDRMIAPDLERDFAKKLHATTTELKASHVSMLSQPQAVADVIVKAASQR